MPADSNTGHDLRAALTLVAVGVCAALHVWKLPPALPALQSQLGLNLVESGFLLSIVQLGGMLLGLLIGLAAVRVGLRRCVMAGMALLAIASAAGTRFDTAGAMMLFRGIEGCGFLMAAMPVPSLLRRLVPPSHLSRIMGLWSCYMPLGTVIILITGAWVLSVADWQTLWLLLAALTAGMLLLAWRWVPADNAAARAATAQGSVAAGPWRMIRQTLGSKAVWLVALTFGMYSAQWIAIIGFLPTIYAAAGISGTTAGALTGLVAGANIIGNLAAGQLIHRGLAPHRLIVIGFGTMIACAYATFGAGLPAVPQFVAVALLSAVGGLIPATLFVLAIAVAPTPQTTTTTVGWLQQCSSLGQFVGPPVVAWVVNVTGGWQSTWLATGAYAAVGIVLALALGRTIRPAEVC